MYELIVDIPYLHIAALDTALREALPTKVFGVMASIDSNGQVRSKSKDDQGHDTIIYGKVRIALADGVTAPEESTIRATAVAHNPVYIAAGKTRIAVNELVAIMIWAPNVGNSNITLQYSFNGSNPADWVIPLTAGLGSDSIAAPSFGFITVTVKNPNNRSTDQCIIEVR